MPLNRRRAREVALQILYADDLNPQRDLTEADEFLCRRLRDVDPLVNFARGLVAGVRRCRGDIDAALGRQASNWSLDRMAAIDRNLLRLGVYELLHTETPAPVVLNEVIELAKRFGGRQSHQFVNGVLDKLVPPQRAMARRSSGDKSGKGPVAQGRSGNAGAGTTGSTSSQHGGAAARGSSPSQSGSRHGVVSRYGLTVRPRVKETANGPPPSTGTASTGTASTSAPSTGAASTNAASTSVTPNSPLPTSPPPTGMLPVATQPIGIAATNAATANISLSTAEDGAVNSSDAELSAGHELQGHDGKGAADGVV
ncbi:MAG: transcription antitermination factor NusB [Planctomycetota bacterium]